MHYRLEWPENSYAADILKTTIAAFKQDKERPCPLYREGEALSLDLGGLKLPVMHGPIELAINRQIRPLVRILRGQRFLDVDT
jgi:hypothetical protein